MNVIQKIQDFLNYKNCKSYHFRNEKSLGRIALTSLLLGCTLTFHVILLLFSNYMIRRHVVDDEIDLMMYKILKQWCIYVSFLCSFHILEFFSTALNQDMALSDNSFVVNHSIAYTIAALLSWIEYWIEISLSTYYLNVYSLEYKMNYINIYLGILFLIGGQFMRTYAMLNCGKNFSHLIMTEKRDDHQLVTTGIYSVLRHPSYFGFFYWSIGTQIFLGNPVSFLIYTAASWTFFYERIPIEEETLYHFYGEEYASYCRNTYIGIPFITSTICSSTTNSNNTMKSKCN